MRFLWGALINIMEPNATRRFHQFGYGCMISPTLRGSGEFLGACDRFIISTAQLAHNITLTSTQPSTKAGIAHKGCGEKAFRKLDPASELDALLSTRRFDVALLQDQSLGQICDDAESKYERTPEDILASIRRHQPTMPVLRRGAISWSPWSLSKGHCVSLQKLDAAEATLRRKAGRRKADAEPPLTVLPMLHITKPLYALARSSGVHAMPSVNLLFAHLVSAQVTKLLAGG